MRSTEGRNKERIVEEGPSAPMRMSAVMAWDEEGEVVRWYVMRSWLAEGEGETEAKVLL